MKNRYFIFLLFASFNILNINAQTKKEDFYIDKFEKANFQTLTTGKWYTYSDSSNNGGSFLKTRYIKDKGFRKQFLEISFQLHKEDWQWTPYAAIACSLSTDQTPQGAEGIAYDFKGSKHRFIYRSNQIKDYAFHQREIPDSYDWTTVFLPFSALKQPSWGGKRVDFDASEVHALAWEVFGENGDTGKLELDNIRLVYSPIKLSIPKSSPVSDFKLGTVETLNSKILKEERIIWIYLPKPLKELQKSTEKYPVIYLLDGDAHITSLASMIEYLGPKLYNSAIPEMIIVGILNTNRWRDLSPTKISKSPYGHDTSMLKMTGGGKDFMQFIEKELIPHIDSTLPTAPYRTFIGHSLGGLTVLNTLIHAPHIFNSYISIDPSLWWDENLLIRQADSVLRKGDFKNEKVFIAIANTNRPNTDTVKIKSDTSRMAISMRSLFRFTDMLKKRSNSGLKWKHTYYPDDSHGSVPVIAHYDGLRYIFKNYQIPFMEDVLTTKGFDVDSAFTSHYNSLSNEMGYPMKAPEKFIDDYGMYLMSKKEFQKAEMLLKMNVRNYPLSLKALKSLGYYYEETNDKLNAIQAYSKAYKFKPNPTLKKKIEELEKSK